LAGSPDAQLSFWLMIASIAIAVLPVCVDGLDAGLQRLLDRLPLHDRRRLQLKGAQRGVLDRAKAVERLAERTDHAAEERVPDRDREDLASPLDLLALFDLGELAKDDDTDLAHVQVQREAADAVLELEKLVRHGRRQTLDPRDAVAGLDDRADLFALDALGLILFDEPRQRVADLIRPDCQLRHLPHSVRK
jgi:hypothetical protein